MVAQTGRVNGLELSGEEKLRAYRERFGDAPIDEFYSDSRRDAPLAALAKRAFIVKKGGIVVPWDEDGEKTEI
jgi:phosphoserine phosphatase